MDKELIVFSVGGSLIVPEQIDIKFLEEFRDLILKQVEKGRRFVIICGGGKTARKYQEVTRLFTNIDALIDEAGIKGTIINAQLLKTILNEIAYPKIIENPEEKIEFKEKILIASGWKPGFSTDYDAVILSKNFRAKRIINLTNVDYVYSENPKKNKNAEPLKKISWEEFKKLLPKKWVPGLNVPFDPVAAKEAQKLGLEVIIMNGRNIKNIENYLDGKNFIGTRIY